MDKISLYVHIPFCKRKCFYCDFPSYAGKEYLVEEYVECLIQEIQEKCKLYEIQTIFIGGGTPSYLEPKFMKKILETIKKLNLNSNLEFTIECNPGSLNYEKLNLMKEFGVNRISMGLQAIQPSLLKGIGRIHNFEEFKENFKMARELGFNNINADLMFGLPTQTLSNWKETLEEVIKLNPEHISAYSLIIEEGTPFYNMDEEGKLLIPAEDDERNMYNLTLNMLKDAGYEQYEISNYAKHNLECKHNLVYWNMDKWIGVGSSAASYINGKRLKNFSLIEDYIRAIKNNKSAYEEVIENSNKDNIEEFMFMGLRKIKGIEEYEFRKRFKINIDEVYGTVLKKYIDCGLLKREYGRVYLTKKGIEFSNNVMSEFLLN
ncbi:coproporphyrinogen III oxidase, anaerobic [Clostridium cavendishii DSM 21758]|uniref:Heme chaperone HemW n=1 Tax=Clostridium cavendishii DSM 21758 TaxID=1121302 RepID=A0A1M6ANX0_9CLOT|nr:radical SAM family heme chaperone HemW [Clostridium cavendishii]SHI38176.1 coproporphyrinogen III oxidase, anaerobic [Clostridium cavendishii DSM 21758]